MRLEDLQLFVQAADAGNFSRVARQLNITPAFVSGAILRLEKSLGVRLFIRNTRNQRLSDEGARYLPHARLMITAMQQGEQSLRAAESSLRGTLRLSAPSDFGRNLLLPWLDEFLAQHPQLTVQLRLSDRSVDLVSEPLDVAIRYGQLSDSSLVAWALAPEIRRTLCAAPDWLLRHTPPRNPEDLMEHNCLGYVWREQAYQRWRFLLPDGEKVVSVRGDRFSDDADVVRRWALSGQGLVYKSRLDLLPDIMAGRLVELFPPEWGEPAPLQLVAAHRAQLTPAVQQLKNWLQQQCAQLLHSENQGMD